MRARSAPRGRCTHKRIPGRWCALWDKRRWPPRSITWKSCAAMLADRYSRAPEPEGVGPEKYDETALAMVAELKYGSGMPFNRIENLEERLGVPLPAGDERTGVFTSAVLSVVRQEEGPEGAPEGNGERRMALYFSGREHAGENLAKVLKKRAAENSQAMLMTAK